MNKNEFFVVVEKVNEKYLDHTIERIRFEIDL